MIGETSKLTLIIPPKRLERSVSLELIVPTANGRVDKTKAERLKLKGNWKDLVKKSLAKKKPAEGWPK